MRPNAGETICGRVRIDADAAPFGGARAFGSPLVARALPQGDRLWLTVIERELVPSAVALSRFMAGAHGLLEMRHPALVRVDLVDREADFCVIGSAALPDARSLASILDTGGGPALAGRAAVELARALAFLHVNHRVHGALAIGNVIVRNGAPMIAQHGIAELCDGARLVARARQAGADPIAPEVASGGPLDARADVYAWGSVMAAMLTGLDGPDAIDAMLSGAGVGGALAAVVAEALDPEADTRTPDAFELLHRLADPGGANARDRMGPVRDLAARYLDELELAIAGPSPNAIHDSSSIPAGTLGQRGAAVEETPLLTVPQPADDDDEWNFDEDLVDFDAVPHAAPPQPGVPTTKLDESPMLGGVPFIPTDGPLELEDAAPFGPASMPDPRVGSGSGPRPGPGSGPRPRPGPGPGSGVGPGPGPGPGPGSGVGPGPRPGPGPGSGVGPGPGPRPAPTAPSGPMTGRGALGSTGPMTGRGAPGQRSIASGSIAGSTVARGATMPAASSAGPPSVAVAPPRPPSRAAGSIAASNVGRGATMPAPSRGSPPSVDLGPPEIDLEPVTLDAAMAASASRPAPPPTSTPSPPRAASPQVDMIATDDALSLADAIDLGPAPGTAATMPAPPPRAEPPRRRPTATPPAGPPVQTLAPPTPEPPRVPTPPTGAAPALQDLDADPELMLEPEPTPVPSSTPPQHAPPPPQHAAPPAAPPPQHAAPPPPVAAPPPPVAASLELPLALGGGDAPRPPSATPPTGVPLSPAQQRAAAISRPDFKLELDLQGHAARPSASQHAGALPPPAYAPVRNATRSSKGTGAGAAIWIGVTLLAVGITIPVAMHRGGLASFLGLRDANTEDATTATTAPTSPTPSEGAKAVAKAAVAPPPPPGACPPDTVRIGASDTELTCIDAGEYPGLREIPRVDVALAEARSLCAERGRRLCTNNEWRRACEGPSRTALPYGPSHVADTCNEARRDGSGSNLSRSGARDRCVSAEGAYDLVGNVGEWVEEGAVLGGDATSKDPTCSARADIRASATTPSTGFRCCVTVPTH